MEQIIESTGVLIADRQVFYRHGLIGLLRERKPSWRCTEVASLAELEVQLRARAATLVIVDTSLPDLNGAEGLGRLRDEYPNRIFVVLSDSDDRECILKCLAAGAQAYILKSSSGEQFLRAIETVLSGGVFAPASLMGASIHAPIPPQTRVSPMTSLLAHLTERQRDVFLLLAEGYSTKCIARELDLAIGTVKVHLAGIYRLLGARSRLEALAKAHRGYAVG